MESDILGRARLPPDARVDLIVCRAPDHGSASRHRHQAALWAGLRRLAPKIDALPPDPALGLLLQAR